MGHRSGPWTPFTVPSPNIPDLAVTPAILGPALHVVQIPEQPEAAVHVAQSSQG